MGMSLWQTLLRPDREEEEFAERAFVARAANILQVGEFQLLQLAYREWFGKDLPEALVSKLFAAYMLKNDVPHWARHYARSIIERDASGAIDDRRAAYHVYNHDYQVTVPRGGQRFWAAVAVLLAFIGGSVILAEMSIRHPVSMFPPYLEQEDLPKTSSAQSFGRADGVGQDQKNFRTPPVGMLPAPP